MFATSVLDVGIGVLLVFLAVSLAASAATEAIASLLGLRQAFLQQGVCNLLNDPAMTGLARELYATGLANPLSVGTPITARPTSIHPRLFAASLAQVLHARAASPDLETALASVEDVPLRRSLEQLLHAAGGDASRFADAVAAWFEAAMRQLTGFYKRRTQAISFVVALAIAIAANADALRVAGVIWRHTIVVSGAASLTGIDLARLAAPGNCSALVLSAAADGLLGWTGHEPDLAHPLALARMCFGWLIVATASLYGAAFWFDLLQRFVHLRGADDDRPARRP